MGLSMKIDDIPQPWRSAASFAGFAVLIAAMVVGFMSFVRSEARAEAVIVTRQVLAQDLESFKSAAMDAAERAAREGAEKAIREYVAPVSLDVAKHRAEDDERVKNLNQRVDRIEQQSKR